jgi:hypothetical protein
MGYGSIARGNLGLGILFHQRAYLAFSWSRGGGSLRKVIQILVFCFAFAITVLFELDVNVSS